MLEALGGALAGTFAGTFTGLLPGLHVNTVALVLLSFASKLPLEFLLSLFVSMAIAHTIIDFIPSIFLGAPEDSTALSVLPGHKLLLKGQGYRAFYLTLVGGVFSMVITLLALPFLLICLKPLYFFLRNYIFYILLFISISIILGEKKLNKIFFSSFCFLLAGILGIIVFERNFVGTNVLLPVFTGLFGTPTIIYSLFRKRKIIKQKVRKVKIERKRIALNSIKSFLSSLFVGILPGLGAAQAATLSTQFSKNDEDFLMVIGGINTVVAFISLLSLILVGYPRSGIAFYLKRIVEPKLNFLLLLVGSSLFSISLSSFIGLKLSKIIAKSIEKFDYKMISLAILSFVTFIVLYFTGIEGLLVYVVSTLIGMLAPILKVKRSNYMGVLILPLLFFYA